MIQIKGRPLPHPVGGRGAADQPPQPRPAQRPPACTSQQGRGTCGGPNVACRDGGATLPAGRQTLTSACPATARRAGGLLRRSVAQYGNEGGEGEAGAQPQPRSARHHDRPVRTDSGEAPGGLTQKQQAAISTTSERKVTAKITASYPIIFLYILQQQKFELRIN